MRSHSKPRPYESLARLARWLGFDRNPLRRGTDRIDAVLRRLSAWEAEWRAAGPLWSGRR